MKEDVKASEFVGWFLIVALVFIATVLLATLVYNVGYRSGQKDVDVIIHQTNCQGVMGRGFAKQIKEKFPEAFEAYKDSPMR